MRKEGKSLLKSCKKILAKKPKDLSRKGSKVISGNPKKKELGA